MSPSRHRRSRRPAPLDWTPRVPGPATDLAWPGVPVAGTVGGGGGGMGFAMFGSGTARYIAQELAREPKLKSSQYQIEIRVWISKDGRFRREEIVRGTGDRDLDTLIQAGLNQLGTLSTPVPQDLPQPLRIRVTSSDA
jgi:protein TonB